MSAFSRPRNGGGGRLDKHLSRGGRHGPPPPPLDIVEAPPAKMLDVTVTILSLSGLHVMEAGKKKAAIKPPSFAKPWFQKQTQLEQEKESDDASDEDAAAGPTTTTVVASYERSNDAESGIAILTHVPSLPLPTLSSGKKGTALFDDVVHWPAQDEGSHSKLSSFTFKQAFPLEVAAAMAGANTKPRYEPQICPIQVCVGRNGKMFKMGSAHVIVLGEEVEATGADVPVVNFETTFGANNNGGSPKNGKVELKRLRGDTIKCGLAERAKLRVLVRVSDPNPSAAEKEDVTTRQKSLDEWERYVASPTSIALGQERVHGNEVPSAGRDRRDDDWSNASYSTSSSCHNEDGSRRSCSYDTEDCSLYSGTSSELLRMIDDISKQNRTRSEGTGITMSSSVQSYRRRRGGRGERQHDEDDSTVTSATSASVDSQGNPLGSPFTPYPRKNRFTLSRLVCCAGGGGIGSGAKLARGEEWLMGSIDEGSEPYRDDKHYSLEGREHSGGSISQRTPW